MLAYLDALLAALTIRDLTEVERLLAHPLARALSDAARDEARRIGRDGDPLAAPLRLMQLRHVTAQLLAAPDTPTVADRADARESGPADPVAESRRPAPPPRRVPRLVQMELPLSA